MNIVNGFKNALMLAICVTTSSSYAVQPLTDFDMETVSAELSQNVLNVLGSSAAGLRDDTSSQLEIAKGKVSDLDNGASSIASDFLEDSETIDSTQALLVSQPQLTFEEAEEIISKDIVVNRSANEDLSLFETTSEVRYKKSSYTKDVEILDPGTVVQTRDITVDLIKIENLSGSFDDDDEIAGSLYLSDFRTQGTTTLIQRQ